LGVLLFGARLGLMVVGALFLPPAAAEAVATEDDAADNTAS